MAMSLVDALQRWADALEAQVGQKLTNLQQGNFIKLANGTVRIGCRDTQNHDTLHNDIQHNNTWHNGFVCDTQHKRHSA